MRRRSLSPALVELALVALAALAGGCATNQQKYNWGRYDPALYAYYKNPDKLTGLSAALDGVIKTGDSSAAKVPPGIYAEYGYLQLQAGKRDQAIELFKQEEAHWPESKVFMDRMIKVSSETASVPAAQSSPP